MKKFLIVLAAILGGINAYAQFSDDYTHFAIGKYNFVAAQDLDEIIENRGGLYRFTGMKEDLIPFYKRSFCDVEGLAEIEEKYGVVFFYITCENENTWMMSIYIGVKRQEPDDVGEMSYLCTVQKRNI